tara:strand:+ start:855 stop:1460 length:606 start_codon:yes stop_codon:yes gene_type:complete
MSYRLIVGLGNPGAEYDRTRHNIGFRVLDAFAHQVGAEPWKRERSFKGELSFYINREGEKVILFKPGAFMNASGVYTQKVSSFFKIPPVEMIVIYDEINLNVGEQKVSIRGSAGGHNGVADILQRIPPVFTRLRIGVGPKTIKEMDLADFVLGKFREDEESQISASMDGFLESLKRLTEDGSEKAMIHINRRTKKNDSNQE